ncbi:MAG: D-aminoacylase [Flavobacteriaceae bacterium]|nr:D-aminoacylase [Flavobacteriaceae bacterium]
MKLKINLKKISLGFITLLLVNCQNSIPFDLIIKNGLVYDGTQNPPQRQDIAIKADKIVGLGNFSEADALQILDAAGAAVAPGFIDTHTHLDPLDNLLALSNSESQLRQGVTTSIGGPDGRGVPLQYGFAAFLDTLSQVGVGINMGFMAGHNKIRKKIMQLENRAPTKKELDRMIAMADQAMDEGAFGLSTGLKYLPGNFAKIDEVIALSRVVANKGGVYSTHLRDEGIAIMPAIEETIEIGKKANIPIILTHHKVIGKPMWGKSYVTLARVDKARNDGVNILLDQYPYAASHTGLSVLIPAWARAGGQEKFIERLSNPESYAKIKAEIIFNILNDRGGEDLNRIQFARVKWQPDLEGKTLKEWIVMEGKKPTIENGAEYVIKGQRNGGASCIYHAMEEKDVEKIMQHPLTMIASDGRLSSPGIGHPHPRAYGTFPRVLGKYVREKKLLSLQEAIYKMTLFPAKTYGIENRGQLKKGLKADLVIFDPNTIIDKATFIQPHQYPVGISHVLVNGKWSIKNGEFLNKMNGVVLRKTIPSTTTIVDVN